MKKDKIIIVEDTKIIALDLNLKLEKFGYEIIGIYDSGEKAIEAIQKSKPDIILMDIMLAGNMSGIDTAERINQLFNMPVIYLTGSTSHDIIEKAKKTRPLGYILKPYNEQQLQITLEMAREKYKADLELEMHKNHLEDLVKQRTIELIKAKEKAEESEKLKMAFLANISHEIRTPMNSIIGFAGLVSQPDLNTAKRQEFSNYLNNSAQSLLRLIDDLIDISEIESGKTNIKISKCYINKVINEIYITYKNKIEADSTKKIEFKPHIDITDESIHILSDAQRIRQIFKYLLENAIKYTEKGIIEFGYTCDNKNVTFFVRDTGIGIPSDKHQAIFESFSKFADSKEKLYRGAGLGLTLTKKILEMLNGSIWVDSVKNKGSVFYFNTQTQPISAYIQNQMVQMNSANAGARKMLIISSDLNSSNYCKFHLNTLSINTFTIDPKNSRIPEQLPVKISGALFDTTSFDSEIEIRNFQYFYPNIPIFLIINSFDEHFEIFSESDFLKYIYKPLKKNNLLNTIQTTIAP